MKKIFFVLFLIGCDDFSREYTENELKFVNELAPAHRAYMDSCYLYGNPRFYQCQEYLMKEFAFPCREVSPEQKAPQVQSNGGSNVLGTAAGTIIGIGAAKMLFGK